MIEEEHIEKAAKDGYENLGPNYFAANDLCKKFFEEWEPEHLDGIAKEVSKTVSDRLFDDLRDFIWEGSLEYSLQVEAYRMVDDTVKALLTGKEWAVKKYVLNDRYGDGKLIRETLVKIIPEEIQNKRIADLEKELEEMKAERDRWIETAERRLHQY